MMTAKISSMRTCLSRFQHSSQLRFADLTSLSGTTRRMKPLTDTPTRESTTKMSYLNCLLPPVALLKPKWRVAIVKNGQVDVALERREGVGHRRFWEVKMIWKTMVISTTSWAFRSLKRGRGGSTTRGVIKTILKGLKT